MILMKVHGSGWLEKIAEIVWEKDEFISVQPRQMVELVRPKHFLGYSSEAKKLILEYYSLFRRNRTLGFCIFLEDQGDLCLALFVRDLFTEVKKTLSTCRAVILEDGVCRLTQDSALAIIANSNIVARSQVGIIHVEWSPQELSRRLYGLLTLIKKVGEV